MKHPTGASKTKKSIPHISLPDAPLVSALLPTSVDVPEFQVGWSVPPA